MDESKVNREEKDKEPTSNLPQSLASNMDQHPQDSAPGNEVRCPCGNPTCRLPVLAEQVHQEKQDLIESLGATSGVNYVSYQAFSGYSRTVDRLIALQKEHPDVGTRKDLELPPMEDLREAWEEKMEAVNSVHNIVTDKLASWVGGEVKSTASGASGSSVTDSKDLSTGEQGIEPTVASKEQLCRECGQAIDQGAMSDTQ